MNALTIGLTIETSDGDTFNTLEDWGLAVGNTDYIGEPIMEQVLIDVPYRSGVIDLSEAITGYPVFKTRALSFYMGGIRERLSWDTIISDLRNKIEGKMCKITLDNDPNFYWQGRVFISDYSRIRKLGTFNISVPNADAYKYEQKTSNEPWEWDPFSFVNGVIRSIGEITVSGEESVLIPYGYMIVSPEFIVADSANLEVTDGTHTHELVNGRNRFPDIKVNGKTETTLTFTGNGKVTIVYRGGSL